MENTYAGNVRIHGRSFDLKKHDVVKALLSSRSGRKTIEKWLNFHQDSPYYSLVRSNVSSLTGGVEGFTESMIATATIATCIMSPGLSSSQTSRAVFSGTCKVCHVADEKAMNKGLRATAEKKLLAVDAKRRSELSREASFRRSETKELTFITLGSRGQGVKAVGEVYEVEGSVRGKVGAARLAFRDAQGMRVICELGKYPPRGAEVLLGNKAYRMWKGGVQWNMRNVLSINGIPAGGNIFIAEYFVKTNISDTNSLQVRNKKDRIKEIQKRYALAQAKTTEASVYAAPVQEPSVQEAKDKEKSSGKTVDNVTAAKETHDNKPEYAYYQARESGKTADETVKSMVDNISGNKAGVSEGKNACELVQYFGGLTVCHVFTKNPDSATTLHEAFLKAYPKMSVKEVLDVPLAEIQKDTSKYISGVDRRVETEMLLLINKELAVMFGDYTTRRLPAPDGRLVTGAKIVGEDEYFKYIYIHLFFSFNNGQWVAINDDFLVKIMQSEPLPSYMTVGTH